jgi:putative transposase
MARLPRLYIPGLPTHIRCRGNDKQPIVHSNGDRIFLHRCLAEACRRHQVQVHAYVLMDNHFHLLATGQHRDSVARAIQCVGRRYVSYFNYLYGRTGTLWEGRYRSCPVQSERYFLDCQRYIELNPVRAGLVDRAAGHLWSSHRKHLGIAEDDLVSPHATYLGLAGSAEERYAFYRQLFGQPLPMETIAFIRESIDKGMALGDERFCEELQAATGRRTRPGRRGRPPKKAKAGPAAPISSMGV